MSNKRAVKLFAIIAVVMMTLTAAAAIVDYSDENNENSPISAAPSGKAIRTVEEFKKIGVDSAYPVNGSYYLANDLDFAGASITTIATNAAATFDGNGFTISNISSTTLGSLFATVGTLKNLTLANCNWTISKFVNTETYAGMMANSAYAVENCHLKNCNYTIDNLNQNSYNYSAFVGGMVGIVSQNVKDSTSTGGSFKVISLGAHSGYGYMPAMHIGGIAGRVYGAVSNCYSASSLDAPRSSPAYGVTVYGGGIVGLVYGAVSDCWTSGPINVSSSGSTYKPSTLYLGGIAGQSSNTITRSYTTGTISSTNGLNSDAVKNIAYIGGIVGKTNSSITYCYNTNDLSYNGDDRSFRVFMGGIAGDTTGSIDQCYNTGKVQTSRSSPVYSYYYSETAVGGIAGNSTSSVTNCYNRGSVTSVGYNSNHSSMAGGIVGTTNSMVLNTTTTASVKWCYNTGVISSRNNSYMGGIYGHNGSGATIDFCYNKAGVGGNKLSSSAVTIDGGASPSEPSNGAMSDPNMKIATSFNQGATGWKFNNIWTINGSAYPELRIFTVSILTQPADVAVFVGETATFSVGTQFYCTYQWWEKKSTGSWSLMPGKTESTLTVGPTVIGDSGTKYRCDVTRGAYKITSDEATLTVTPPMYTIKVNENLVGGSISPGTGSHEQGSTPEFKIIPDSGFKVVSVLVDGGEVLSDPTSETYTYTFPALTAGHEITAKFEYDLSQTFIITSDPVTNGSIDGDSPIDEMRWGPFQAGSKPVFTVSPAQGYKVATVEIDGDPISLGDYTTGVFVYTFAPVTSDHHIFATFEPDPTKSHNVDITDDGNGTASASHTNPVAGGTNVTITIEPDPGYRLLKITDGGEDKTTSVSGGKYIIYAITASHEIVLTFEPDPTKTHHISVSVTKGKGTAVADETAPNGGSDVKITITAESGWIIKRIYDNERERTAIPTATENVFEYVISAVVGNHTVTVEFEPDSTKYYNVTATAGSNGSITPSGTQSVQGGQDIEFTLTHVSQYHIASVTIDGEKIPWTEATYKFQIVTRDHSIFVEFEPDPYIYVSCGPNGKVTYDGGQATHSLPVNISVIMGGSMEFTFEPDPGYKYKGGSFHVTGDGAEPYSGTGTYTLSDITGTYYTLYVEFIPDEEIQYTIEITDDGNGSGTANPAGEISGGMDVTITITPKEGYRLRSITDNGEDVTASVVDGKYTINTVVDDHDIELTFYRYYTVNVTTDGNGTVEWVASSGSNILTNPSEIPAGYGLEFIATNGSQKFSGWIVNGIFQADDESRTLVLTPTGDIKVVAVFVTPNPGDNGTSYTLDITQDGTGTVGWTAINGTITLDNPTVVPTGYTVTIKGTGASDMELSGWIVDGTFQPKTDDKLEFTMTANKVIIVVFVTPSDGSTSYSLSVDCDGDGEAEWTAIHGTITLTNPTVVPAGYQVIITAKETGQQRLSGWIVNKAFYHMTSMMLYPLLTEDTEVIVVFVTPNPGDNGTSYTLDITQDGTGTVGWTAINGTITLDNPTVVPTGYTVTIKGTGASDMELSGWIVDGTFQPKTDDKLEFTMTANKVIIVVFVTPNPGDNGTSYTLDITQDGTGTVGWTAINGTITLDNPTVVPTGYTVTIKGTGASEMELSGWIVDGTFQPKTDDKLEFTMTANKVIIVVFVTPNPGDNGTSYTLDITQDGTGTVGWTAINGTITLDNPTVVPTGYTVTIKGTGASEMELSGWIVDGTFQPKIGATLAFTMTANKVIIVVFVTPSDGSTSYSLSVDCDGDGEAEWNAIHGTITLTNPTVVPAGYQVIITAKETGQQRLSGWIVNKAFYHMTSMMLYPLLTEDTEVIVVFVTPDEDSGDKTFTVTIDQTGEGTVGWIAKNGDSEITGNPTTVPMGYDIIVTASGTGGYELAGWIVDGDFIDVADNTGTFTPAANFKMTVVFVTPDEDSGDKTFTVTIDQTGEGTVGWIAKNGDSEITGNPTTVPMGYDIIVTASGTGGYELAGWIVDGDFIDVADNTGTFTPAANFKMTVVFVTPDEDSGDKTFTVTIDQTGEGTVGWIAKNGDSEITGNPTTVPMGYDIIVTASGTGGYELAGWIVDGDFIDVADNTGTFTPAANFKMTVVFVTPDEDSGDKTFTVTIDQTGEGTVGWIAKNGDSEITGNPTTVPMGYDIIVTASGTGGYELAGWIVDGDFIDVADNTGTFTPAANFKMTVVFVTPDEDSGDKTFTVTIDQTGEGTVGWIAKNGDSEITGNPTTVPMGYDIIVTASGTGGYELAGWIVDGDFIDVADNTGTFTPAANFKMTVVFVTPDEDSGDKTFTVTIDQTGEGTVGWIAKNGDSEITGNPTTVPMGYDIIVTASGTGGYELAGWIVDGDFIDVADNTGTFTPAANFKMTVVFVTPDEDSGDKTFTVTIDQTGEGTVGWIAKNGDSEITGNPTTVPMGYDIIVTASGTGGYELAGWIVDGDFIDVADNTGTFTPAANFKMTVVFVTPDEDSGDKTFTVTIDQTGEGTVGWIAKNGDSEITGNPTTVPMGYDIIVTASGTGGYELAGWIVDGDFIDVADNTGTFTPAANFKMTVVFVTPDEDSGDKTFTVTIDQTGEGTVGWIAKNGDSEITGNPTTVPMGYDIIVTASGTGGYELAGWIVDGDFIDVADNTGTFTPAANFKMTVVFVTPDEDSGDKTFTVTIDQTGEGTVGWIAKNGDSEITGNPTTVPMGYDIIVTASGTGGYELAGWIVDGDFIDVADNTGTFTPAANFKMTVVFVTPDEDSGDKTFTVTIDQTGEGTVGWIAKNGDSEITGNPTTVPMGYDIIVTASGTGGYELAGWIVDGDFIDVADNTGTFTPAANFKMTVVFVTPDEDSGDKTFTVTIDQTGEGTVGWIAKNGDSEITGNPTTVPMGYDIIVTASGTGGYELAGWIVDGDFIDVADNTGTFTPAANFKMTVVFVTPDEDSGDKTFTVTIDQTGEGTVGWIAKNGDSEITGNPTTVPMGYDIIVTASGTGGYELAGWIVDGDFIDVADNTGTFTPAANFKMTVVFVTPDEDSGDKTFTVTIDQTGEGTVGWIAKNGDSEITGNPTTVPMGYDIIVTASGTGGYELAGWIVDGDFIDVADNTGTFTPAANFKMTVVFVTPDEDSGDKTFTVTIDQTGEGTVGWIAKNGDSEITGNPTTVPMGYDIIVTASGTGGYELAGWIVDGDFIDVADNTGTFTPAANFKMTVVFVTPDEDSGDKTFTVTIDQTGEGTVGWIAKNGDSEITGNPTTVPMGYDIIVTASGTGGYELAGWIVDGDFIDVADNTGTFTPAANFKMTVVFVTPDEDSGDKTFTVTIDQTGEGTVGWIAKNGDSEITGNPTTVPMGYDIIVTASGTGGYELAGWIVDGDFIDVADNTGTFTPAANFKMTVVFVTPDEDSGDKTFTVTIDQTGEGTVGWIAKNGDSEITGNPTTVPMGYDIIVTASGTGGYELAGWIVDGDFIDVADNTGTFTPAANFKMTVVFVTPDEDSGDKTFTVTIDQTGEGTVGWIAKNGDSEITGNPTTVPMGYDIIVTASGTGGYELAGWIVDGDFIDVADNTGTFTPAANFKMTVVFVTPDEDSGDKTFTVTIDQTGEGTVGWIAKNGDSEITGNPTTVPMGYDIIVTASGTGGYELAGWIVDGDFIDVADNTGTFTPAANFKMTVVFVTPDEDSGDKTFTVTIDQTGEGTVGWIAKNGDSEITGNPTTVPMGYDIIVTASGTGGYELAGWIVDGDFIDVADNTGTFTPAANFKMTVVFVTPDEDSGDKTFTVTIDQTGEGTVGWIAKNGDSEITGNPTTVPMGYDIIVTASGTGGYELAGWIVDGDFIDVADNTGTFTPAANFKMTVVFVTPDEDSGDKTFTVTIDQTGEGTVGWIAKNGDSEITGNPTTVPMGYDIIVTASGTGGYELAGWIVDGDFIDVADNTGTFTPAANFKMTVVFVTPDEDSGDKTFTVTIDQTGEGTVGWIAKNGDSEITGNPTTVPMGYDIIVTASGTGGYELAGWIVDGDFIDVADNTGTFTPAANFKMTVVFVTPDEDSGDKTFTVTIDQTGEGTVGWIAKNGDSEITGNPTTVPMGYDIIVTASGTGGYELAGWIVDGDFIDVADNTGTFTPAANFEMTVVFVTPDMPDGATSYTFDATVDGDGTVSWKATSPSGEIVLIDPTLVPAGYKVVVTAENGEQTLYGWSINSGTPFATTTGLAYTIDAITANTTVKALFVTPGQEYSVDVTVSVGEGQAVPDTNPAPYRSDVTITITPGPGWKIKTITDNNVTKTATDNLDGTWSYVISAITEDHTVLLEFEVDRSNPIYSITATCGDNGSISPAGRTDIYADERREYMFAITPDTGYRVANVIVDGVSIGAWGSYTFETVTGHHTIHVTFEEDVEESSTMPIWVLYPVMLVVFISALVMMHVHRNDEE